MNVWISFSNSRCSPTQNFYTVITVGKTHKYPNRPKYIHCPRSLSFTWKDLCSAKGTWTSLKSMISWKLSQCFKFQASRSLRSAHISCMVSCITSEQKVMGITLPLCMMTRQISGTSAMTREFSVWTARLKWIVRQPICFFIQRSPLKISLPSRWTLGSSALANYELRTKEANITFKSMTWLTFIPTINNQKHFQTK